MTLHGPVSKALRPLMRAAFGIVLLAYMGVFSSAQEPEPAQQEQTRVANTSIPAGPRTTVHGMVRVDASGEPLARALVRISGDAATGALTDGDGRFEIPNVPVGPQEFEVVKPGFMDRAAGAEGSSENPHSVAHNVVVVAGMSDIVFAMTRVNSIRGVLQLSTGEPAHAIQVTLLKRTIQDGRVVWQTAGANRTNSEGVYRFGGLADGVYALYTDPTMESEAATDLVEPGRGRSVARGGYASVFYPDARDLAGAAKIRLAGGEQAEADMSLTLEPFHLVAATVGLPSGASDRAGSNFSFLVLDARGHQLPYSAQYDPNTRTMQTLLPDGAYSLVGIASRSPLPGGAAAMFSAPGGAALTGQIDVSVSGQAVSNLRIPLAAARTSPVQVSVMRTGVAPAQGSESGSTASPQDSGVFITVSQTGAWISDGMVMSLAQGSSAGPLESSFVSPGAYWVHTNIAQKGLCESSFTAGGAGLAHEPLVLGSSGATVPLTLTLRDDCASLTLALPASMSVPAAGEEPFYTVYVVPDFESTVDVVPQTLRASSGASITLTGLTPGDYHVYAFNRPVALEYRNPAVLSGLRGQAVTLAPGAERQLVVEAGQQ
jgi:Carboxypeptidase regulatory-like domain